MQVGVELLIIVLLLLVNGVLAGSELAVVSARKMRLQQRAEAGDAGAQVALALADEPGRFLSTVQIGITLVGILTGAFGGATLAETVAAWLTDAGVSARNAELVSVVFVVLGITYLSLIIGELVPKRLALQHPEGIATAVARPMRTLSRIAAPAVTLLSVSTDLVLRLLHVRTPVEAPVSEEEIRLLIQQSTAAGVFEPAEQAMVSSIFRLGDRHVADLMVPRHAVVWLDIDDLPTAVWQEMTASPHTRFPVCRGELDQVLGVVSVKDLGAQLAQGQPADLRAVLRPALVVPETLVVLAVLERFREAGTALAVVVDEHGGVSGILTLTDVLEAIVGALPTPAERADPRVVQRPDGSWLLDGDLPVDEVKAVLGLGELPDEDDYQTLAGFLLHQLGRIPAPADAVEWDGRRFEVLDMDGRRIDKVLVAATTAAA
jgi:putative hemolysin